MREAELIDWLKSRLIRFDGVELGIGDDAAVLSSSPEPFVVTTDMLMEGTDFRLDEVAPERIGRKALAVNLSDLAAMGAVPRAAFVALALPRQGGARFVQQLYDGILELAARFQVTIAGGDTNSWDGPLVICITAIGSRPVGSGWRRSAAEVGDAILVTGEFGGSLLGHHLDFTPRVTEALALRRHSSIHAATDVSDGLSLDLSHILEASGCGAELDGPRIPIRDAARQLAAQSRRTPLDHALSDGEDFELILTMNQAQADRLLAERPFATPLTQIGRVSSDRGIWLTDAAGTRTRLEPRGYAHEFSAVEPPGFRNSDR